MKYFLLFIAFVIAIPVFECVLNGKRSKYGQFPYMVGLVIKYNEVVNCGGAIITNRLIVSSAHCLCDKWSYEYYYALVGTNNLKFGGYHYELVKSICHEFFVPSELANDIGIVKTKIPIEFNINIQYIALQMGDIPVGGYITGAGWGCLDKEQNEFPDILRYDVLEVMNLEECHNIFWESLEFSFLCAKANKSKGMCAGDSGAPVTYEGRFAGVSFGNSDYENMFLMVSKYADWIGQKIFQHNRDKNGTQYKWENNDFNFTHNFLLKKNRIVASPIII